MNFGNFLILKDLGNPEYIISTRCRIARNLKAVPFNVCMQQEDYVKLEKDVRTATKHLQGQFKGEYFSLRNMSDSCKREMIEKHLLFKVSDGNKLWGAKKNRSE